MHMLAFGSAVAVISAWAAAPTAMMFESGLLRTFANAMQADHGCESLDVVIDDGEFLVLLDESGDVTEIELGEMPDVAWASIDLPSLPYILPSLPHIAMASAQQVEETDVTVEVINGDGHVVIKHNGEVREFDLEDFPFDEMMHEHDNNLYELLGRFMNNDRGDHGRHHREHDERHVEMIFEIDGEDGRHMRRRMMIDEEDGPHGMMAIRRGHDRHDMPDRRMEELRRHMEFMRMMREDPEAVWRMIEHLPDDVRGEFEEMMHHMMELHADEHHMHDDFGHQAGDFVHKMQMTRKVAAALEDGEAVAIFSVWQARERMEPDSRIQLLAPMIVNEDLIPSVRNAAAWVVMEAHAELGQSAAGAATLRELILRNGSR